MRITHFRRSEFPTCPPLSAFALGHESLGILREVRPDLRPALLIGTMPYLSLPLFAALDRMSRSLLEAAHHLARVRRRLAGLLPLTLACGRPPSSRIETCSDSMNDVLDRSPLQ